MTMRKPNRVTTPRRAVLNGIRTSHASMRRARGRWRPDATRNRARAPGLAGSASTTTAPAAPRHPASALPLATGRHPASRWGNRAMTEKETARPHYRNRLTGDTVTTYKLKQFKMADAQALLGKTADITEWEDDEFERKVTYPAARVTGIVAHIGPYLVIETAGAEVTDARTGARLVTWAAEPAFRVGFTWICEVANVRDA